MELFYKLPKEKQDRVLNAAFACFGKNGYQKASIADVATAAGVSKASIFQYFKTKRELFLFAFDFACDEIMATTPFGTEDFFESFRLAVSNKVAVIAKYPSLYDFLITLLAEENGEFAEEIQVAAVKFTVEGNKRVFGNVNWGKFKDEYDLSMCQDIIRLVSEGYSRAFAGKKTAEEMKSEIFRYLDFLKKLFYKEEYL